MGVNNKKYVYINRVGLERDSWALKKFEEDAKRHHMVDQPGKLVALRLTEYYELKEEMKALSLSSLPVAAMPQPQQPQRQASAPSIIEEYEEDEDEAEEAGAKGSDDFLEDVDNQWD